MSRRLGHRPIVESPVVAWDDFDGPNGAALNGRVSARGQVWTDHSTGFITNGAGGARNTAGSSERWASLDLSHHVGPVAVEWRYQSVSDNGFAFLVEAASRGYGSVFVGSTGMQRYFYDAGLVKGQNSMPGTGTGTVERVEVDGQTIRFYKDGVLYYSHVDTTPLAFVRRHGLKHYNGGAWDSFRVFRGRL